MILIVLSFFAGACGQKSSIKNAVDSQTIAEAYGDGEYTILPLVMPLSDQELARFDSPLGKIGFIAGGFAKMFMNIGAGMGMGKVRMSLIQQVPQIPAEYFKGARVKRVFFYIEPVKNNKREMSWYQRVFIGRENVDFKFIEKIVVKLASHHVENTESWMPMFDSRNLGRFESSPLESAFQQEPLKNESYIVKYKAKRKEDYLQNDAQGRIYIINTHEPVKTKKFLLNHPKMKGYFKRLHMLNKSLLVELEKDPVVEEGLKVILSESAVELEQLGVRLIEPCTKDTCMDFKVPDSNLVPIFLKDNAIKLDAYIDAGKVPDSFQLKGFIEFEIKLKLTF